MVTGFHVFLLRKRKGDRNGANSCSDYIYRNVHFDYH